MKAFLTTIVTVALLVGSSIGVLQRHDRLAQATDRQQHLRQLQHAYAVPPHLLESIVSAAEMWGIPEDLAIRLVRAESEFNPRAVSRAGAIGLTQVMPSTARALRGGITRDSLFDPTTNLQLGFQYLATLYTEFKDWRLAVLAYRDGPGRAREAQKVGGRYVRFITTGA